MRLRVFTIDTTPQQTETYTSTTCHVIVHVIPPNNTVYALVPGAPDRSGIPIRMNRRDAFGMPAHCTKFVDDAGVATVTAWIASMDSGVTCSAADAGSDAPSD